MAVKTDSVTTRSSPDAGEDDSVNVFISYASADREIATVLYEELTEIDRRRLVFETTVTSGDTVVSEGTHQRFVVRPGG